MNLLLLEPHELDAEGHASITGRRARHIEDVLKSKPPDKVRAGVIDGRLGEAHLIGMREGVVRLRFEPLYDPPAPLPLKLILALPRPKVLSRVLANVTSLGIKEIVLINAYRVEKAYWSSEHTEPGAIRKACLLGLEQARDTVLPRVRLARLFKPFVQDELPEFVSGTRAFVAHPGAAHAAPSGVSGALTIAIGPEGGFIPYEIDLLKTAGFEEVSLGERILKFETAISFLIGRILE